VVNWQGWAGTEIQTDNFPEFSRIRFL